MATLIFYKRIPYSRGRSCVSQHFRHIIRPLSRLHLVGQRLAGFESRLVPDLPLPFIPNLIGLRAFDLVSSPVWWEAVTKKASPRLLALCEAPEPVLDFGPERGSAKGTMADLGPLIRHLVSTRLPSGGRAAFLSPLSPLYGTRPCL